ncbi:MAG: hypothetical protein IJH00_03735 [Erysipelotrichaceae bacterium]|nr:hypothetical protein [Erysipelotrichaceae bacterium]
MKRKIILVSLSLILLIAGSACGKKEEVEPQKEENSENIVVTTDISGDYFAFSCSDKDGNKLELNNETLHLDPDGSGTIEIAGQSYILNWTYKDKEFRFKDEEGDEFVGNYYDQIIAGTYYDGYYFMFTSDRELYQSFLDTGAISTDTSVNGLSIETAQSKAVYYTLQTLYEPTYGIRTAVALVPYGWKASVNVEWGVCSSMYPAFVTIKMVSPDNDAMIEVISTMGYLQMARKGIWTPEGTYLDLYNIYLNYRNAHEYNDFMLGLMGYKGTILNAQGPSYEFQLALNGEANAFLSAMASPNGFSGKSCEGSYEKTSYFITEGNAYEIEISSSVIMAETINGYFDTYTWIVPYTAVFTAYSEEAYANYARVFDNVTANSNFTGEFIYVVQKNAQYITNMIHDYLMEQVYSPSSGDISSWDSEYTGGDNDKYINQWCDVITERDEYTTVDGNSIKVPTSYDTVYQDGDLIYMGPDAYAPQGWTQLNKPQN